MSQTGQAKRLGDAVEDVVIEADTQIMYQIRGAGPTYGISMSAAVLMSVLPIAAFLLMQRQMIQGITIGSLKG